MSGSDDAAPVHLIRRVQQCEILLKGALEENRTLKEELSVRSNEMVLIQ